MGTVRRVTEAQVKELRLWLHQGASLKMAAMKAGMDRKSGRKYREQDRLPNGARGARSWRTREDPLASVWAELEEKLVREPSLQAVTLLGWMQSVYPGVYPDSVRRTLERRVRQWKAGHGPDKEVFFAQVHEPGRLGASDFTHMSSLGVTIAGEAFDHLAYHFVLTHSNWEHVTVCFSESFASLSEGLQNALWVLGGVPQRHRTDRMTLAVHADGQAEQFTARYRALLAHYGLAGEATNPASGHENGDCEQSHRRFKEGVEQALLLRGSQEFASRAEYESCLRELLRQRNRQRERAFAVEAKALQALPSRRLETQERRRVRVRRGSTIQVVHNTYSVPARLIGEYVEVRLGVEELEVWYAESKVQQMPRLRGQNKRHIDYRHIIGWLVRKPGAFARYAYREDLYPTLVFRRAYDRLQAQDAERADKDYVQLLYLAAQEGESAVTAALEQVLGTAQPLRLGAVRALLGQPIRSEVAGAVRVPAVDLGQYDALLTASAALTPEQGAANGIVPEEVKHGGPGGSDAMFDGTALADDASPIRGGGAAGDGGDVGVCRLPAGARPARVPAASGEPDRASAEGLEAAVGEELGGAGPEAFADKGGATVAGPVERRLPGPEGECAGVRSPGIGEDALRGGGGSGVGAGRTAGVVHDERLVGSRPVGGEAGLHAQRPAQTPGPVGSVDIGRPGLCTAEPGGDGSVVHAVGGALRARQCAADEQPAVLEVGADLQGSDDDSGGGGPVGAPQRDRGVEHPKLSGGSRQACETAGGLGVGESPRRAGFAPFALAARGLTALRQPAAGQSHANNRGER
jgi:hypothetical protein